jgi:hypothetical protein
MILPDWLADAGTKRERLRLIMAAVHRCYMEHPDGGMVPTGPHMTIVMAEEFIAQMIEPGEGERRRRLIAEHGNTHSADTAAALRLIGKRDQVHPRDAAAFAYRDRAAADAYAASNAEHNGIPSLGTAVKGDEIIGVLDLRGTLAEHGAEPTDPRLPDDWKPSRSKQEAS